MEKMKLTEGTLRALELLQGLDREVTLRDLNELVEDGKIAPAQVTALVRNGLVDATDTEIEVVRLEKVKTYALNEQGRAYFNEFIANKE